MALCRDKGQKPERPRLEKKSGQAGELPPDTLAGTNIKYKILNAPSARFLFWFYHLSESLLRSPKF